MTRRQVHTYMTDETYGNLETMAGDLGLSESGFLVMLVSKAWNERKAGEPVQTSKVPVGKAMLAMKVAEPVKVEEVEKLTPYEMAKRDMETEQVSNGRKRHKSKK